MKRSPSTKDRRTIFEFEDLPKSLYQLPKINALPNEKNRATIRMGRSIRKRAGQKDNKTPSCRHIFSITARTDGQAIAFVLNLFLGISLLSRAPPPCGPSQYWQTSHTNPVSVCRSAYMRVNPDDGPLWDRGTPAAPCLRVVPGSSSRSFRPAGPSHHPRDMGQKDGARRSAIEAIEQSMGEREGHAEGGFHIQQRTCRHWRNGIQCLRISHSLSSRP